MSLRLLEIDSLANPVADAATIVAEEAITGEEDTVDEAVGVEDIEVVKAAGGVMAITVVVVVEGAMVATDIVVDLTVEVTTVEIVTAEVVGTKDIADGPTMKIAAEVLGQGIAMAATARDMTMEMVAALEPVTQMAGRGLFLIGYLWLIFLAVNEFRP